MTLFSNCCCRCAFKRRHKESDLTTFYSVPFFEFSTDEGNPSSQRRTRPNAYQSRVDIITSQIVVPRNSQQGRGWSFNESASGKIDLSFIFYDLVSITKLIV